MRLIINNTQTTAIVGGKDNLLPFDLLQELRDYLKVRIKGYQNTKTYKEASYAKRKHLGWRQFMSSTGVFATGYVPMIIAYARELGAEIWIQDDRVNLPYFKPEAERIWTINNTWESRDYQTQIVNKFDNYIDLGNGEWLYWPRGIADAATNAGKTTILGCLFKNIENPSGLILIDSEFLLDQLLEFLSTDFDNIGQIRSTKYEYGEEITIAMTKTLSRRLEGSLNLQLDMATLFNVLAVDECHKSGAVEFSQVIQQIDAGMRVFVSGTPLDNQNESNNMVIIGLSGAVLHKISKKELMDKGYSLYVKVFMHLNDNNTPSWLKYTEEQEKCIYKSEIRLNQIAKIISERLDKKIIINFEEYEEHGKFMYEYIRDNYGFDKMDIVHGKDKDRKAKLAAFKAGEIMILFSSSILSTGIDIKDISVLVNARGGKAPIALSQWSGRIERDDGVSDHVELHDFWDTGEYVSKHSRKRVKFYKDEKFEITFLYEQKRGTPSTAPNRPLR